MLPALSLLVLKYFSLIVFGLVSCLLWQSQCHCPAAHLSRSLTWMSNAISRSCNCNRLNLCETELVVGFHGAYAVWKARDLSLESIIGTLTWWDFMIFYDIFYVCMYVKYFDIFYVCTYPALLGSPCNGHVVINIPYKSYLEPPAPWGCRTSGGVEVWVVVTIHKYCSIQVWYRQYLRCNVGTPMAACTKHIGSVWHLADRWRITHNMGTV